jgi:hypothetical protein
MAKGKGVRFEPPKISYENGCGPKLDPSWGNNNIGAPGPLPKGSEIGERAPIKEPGNHLPGGK